MRNPNSSYLRKENLVYNSGFNVSDGFESGFPASAADRSLGSQLAAGIKEIQHSEDLLRQSITEQQNKVLLLDAKNKLSEINQSSFLSFSVDPDGFKKDTTERAKEVFNSLPVQIREVARDGFLQQQNGYFYKALNNQREYLDKQAFEQTQINIQNLAKDATSSILGLFNPNQAANIQAQISLGSSIIEAEMALNGKTSYGTDLFSPLQKQKLYQGFLGTLFEGFAGPKFSSLQTPEEKLQFISEIQNGSAKIIYKDPTTNLDVEISSDVLDQGGRNSIAKGLSERLKNEPKIQQEYENLQYIKDVIAGKILPDPKDKDYRKSVNNYYNSFIKPNISFEDSLQSINLIGDFVKKINTIPEGLIGDLRAYLSSDNFAAFSLASDVVKSISVNNKDLIDYIPNNDIAKALKMNALTNAGLSAEEAFNQIKNSFQYVSEEVRDNRTKTFNKFLNDEKIRAEFEASVMESGWFFWKENKEPIGPVADEFFFQYTDLAREFFVSGADFDTAKESALLAIKKKWGNSVVNGDNFLTAFPPEKYYADYALNGKIMRELMLDFVKNRVSDKLDENRVVVLADKTTYYTAGNPTSKPSYSLCYINDNGVPEPILGEDLSPIRIGENVWNKESRFFYEQNRFKRRIKKEDINLVELLEGEEF